MKLLPLAILLLICTQLSAQQTILPTRDGRIVLGYHMSYNFPITNASYDNQPLDTKNEQNYWNGRLKNASAGIIFDYFSPNSLLGLQAEALYVRKSMSLPFFIPNVSPNYVQNDFLSQGVEIPLYLRFRTGDDQTKNHFVGLLGASYAKVFNLKHRYAGNQVFDDLSYANSDYISFTGGIGIESVLSSSRITGEPIQKRMIIYLKFTYNPTNFFNDNYTSTAVDFTLNDVVGHYHYFSLTLAYTSFGRANKSLF